MVSEFIGYGAQRRTPERRVSGDQFIVEDLLDFSNDDGVGHDDNVGFLEGGHNSNSNSSDACNVVTPPDSGNSSFSGNNDVVFPNTGDNGSHSVSDNQFSGELCVPCDDLAELEWFSNFMEESFSSEDLQKFHLTSGLTSAFKTRPNTIGSSSEIRYYHTDPTRPESNSSNLKFNSEMTVPGKARSKRSRAAPCNWTSRLVVLSDGSPDPSQPDSGVKPVKVVSKKKVGCGSMPRLGSGSGSDLPNGEVRRCLHCATDKTPQWRTGPMGPKTLCNACGVRYKSGRLVPEYRPAASPTFIMTKHSNSHRKVMELRRQKDLMKHQQHFQEQHFHHDYQHQQQLIHHHNTHPGNMMFDPGNPDEYLIHQHIGSDYRQLI